MKFSGRLLPSSMCTADGAVLEHFVRLFFNCLLLHMFYDSSCRNISNISVRGWVGIYFQPTSEGGSYVIFGQVEHRAATQHIHMFYDSCCRISHPYNISVRGWVAIWDRSVCSSVCVCLPFAQSASIFLLFGTPAVALLISVHPITQQ